ncbi:MAG: bifunctional adenosylcobinamide kinase/adenosylcobinamide-phosphate guanylyltransferase [Sporichthyaceae bacterium]
MEVLLLGTGSADGWPNPFCTCASCQALAAAGEVRGHTAALVDDVLLLDCGPEAPRAALRAGRTLHGVRHVLLTHAHPDHLGPAALLWRRWASRDEPLDLVGPAEALAACADWIGPLDPVRLVPLAAGDRVSVGDYAVTAVRAEHEIDCLIYDVTGPDGARLLYATDTGPLPTETVETLRDTSYDLVLLEETFGDVTDHGTGHLDLETFPRVIAGLRDVGAVTDTTDVVAVHLGHGNPPTPELARRLAPWGARQVADGTSIPAPGGVAQPGTRMDATPRRTLILGGARSGKSWEAERRLAAEPRVTYVATARPELEQWDTEWAERVQAHRDRRPTNWVTVETRDVAKVLDDATGAVLVDCLSLWLGDAIGHDDYADRIDDLVAAWRGTRARVTAVSNEVGSGVVPDSVSGRFFRDQLGRLNARIAAESDEVLLTVAGRVVPL